MDLIRGLSNDIARQSLFRIHCTKLFTVSSLSKAWKFELWSPEHWRHRQLVLLNFWHWNDKIRKLIIYEPETNIWFELPPIPNFPNGVPKHFNFHIASFKWGFVIIGAFRRRCTDKKPFKNKVFVFDYLRGTGLRGANMPKGLLYVYNITSDRDRMVYVLCIEEGYSKMKSIMVYDVMNDKWTSEIDTRGDEGDWWMDHGRRMIYQGGKIHLVEEWLGGHTTNTRVFNVSTWEWEPPQYDFPHRDAREICVSDDGEWYSCDDLGTLYTYKDSTWQEIGQVPMACSHEIQFITTWKSNLLLIWKRWGDFKCLKAHLYDLKNHKCTTFETPKEFTGEVRAGCYLEF